ncbi:hypothetical protein BO78DRAFT_399458 [Aspergillus sclerotiicarbonarius CBS 121057]|uniref:Uncharacterized protein n=1 Tax=Aspergillus sclerotiicarbonarius (strain CBS 121057 / IBT 28362) TaxID=1448318 RepID=A0A319FC59_ASPSB|nr:hypothetical protein BO78DRAFT_399458 [Aspergillus sclerotiicarbonarius CBS 121057]
MKTRSNPVHPEPEGQVQPTTNQLPNTTKNTIQQNHCKHRRQRTTMFSSYWCGCVALFDWIGWFFFPSGLDWRIVRGFGKEMMCIPDC